MSADELLCSRKNWNRVVLEGRKPGQVIGVGCSDTEHLLVDVGKALFADLRRVAEVLDSNDGSTQYQQVCDQLVASFDDPELTYSARILQAIKEQGLTGAGVALAEQYRHLLCEEPLEILTEADFSRQAQESVLKQQQLEQSDTLDFASYLAGREG